MVNTESIRTVIGIIGNVISYVLFLSPVPTFWKIYKAKDVEEFKPDPYVMTLLSCAMWVFYGLPIVHPGAILVITTNGFGFLVEIFYITVFLVYSNWPKRRRIFIAIFLEAIFFGVIVGITLGVFHTTKKRSTFVGIICIVLNVGMYVSPLTIMKRVIKTKSVEYMPFYLSLTNFLNGCVWTVYALLKFDINLLVSNGLGAVSGAVQVILYAVYYKRSTEKNKGEEEEKSPHPQLELSITNDKP